MFNRLAHMLAVAMTALALAPGSVSAQVYDLSEIVELRLLEGWRRDDGRHVTALEIQLAPGWKTYWRSPGDGGIPMSLMLDAGPVTVHWPRPEVFHSAGMRSIGYLGSVILPLELDLAAGARAVSGQVALGVCEEICMPVELPVEAVLPDGGRPDPRIIAALTDAPLSAEEAGAGPATCRIRPIADGLRVEMQVPLPNTGGPEDVVFELPDPTIWISEPETTRSGGTLTASADIVPADAGPFALDRSELRITVLGRREAVEISGCVAG